MTLDTFRAYQASVHEKWTRPWEPKTLPFWNYSGISRQIQTALPISRKIILVIASKNKHETNTKATTTTTTTNNNNNNNEQQLSHIRRMWCIIDKVLENGEGRRGQG
jgi:hypothetical protein